MIFRIALIVLSVAALSIFVNVDNKAIAHNWNKDLYEDDVIMCVKDTVKHTQGLICHIFNDLNGTEYQNKVNDASLFNIEDSFSMDLVD